MARPKIWFPALAVAVLALAVPDLTSAQAKTGPTAGATAPVTQKVVKKRVRIIDPSVETCKMFGSDGKTPRPSMTHMTQGDHARIRAEHWMIQEASKGNGDENVYFEALTGDRTNNPKFNRLRADDSLGKKKGCLLSGTP